LEERREEETEHDEPRRVDDQRLGERRKEGSCRTEGGKGRERKGVCSEGGERMGRIDLPYAKRVKEDAVHRTSKGEKWHMREPSLHRNKREKERERER